jgi:hypothetical protein
VALVSEPVAQIVEDAGLVLAEVVEEARSSLRHVCRFDSSSGSVLVEERMHLGKQQQRRMCIECSRVSEWRRPA